ncbi:MAG: SOS response-associated peptidase [Pseudomonadota bacterium]
MCGRYVSPDESAIEREFTLTGPHPRPLFPASFNVAPTQQVPVIRMQGGQRELVRMRFGLIPFFAKGVAGQYSTINARIETVRTSPAYRSAWQRGQRCLIIANGFYEWQVIADGKQPWFISCADQELFAFAGLWDMSTPQQGEPILSCTIITLPASPFMAQIHNTKQREPAILQRKDQEAWLGATPEAAFACLASYPDDLRSAWPVSKRVNSPRNNDAKLRARETY